MAEMTDSAAGVRSVTSADGRPLLLRVSASGSRAVGAVDHDHRHQPVRGVELEDVAHRPSHPPSTARTVPCT